MKHGAGFLRRTSGTSSFPSPSIWQRALCPVPSELDLPPQGPGSGGTVVGGGESFCSRNANVRACPPFPAPALAVPFKLLGRGGPPRARQRSISSHFFSFFFVILSRQAQTFAPHKAGDCPCPQCVPLLHLSPHPSPSPQAQPVLPPDSLLKQRSDIPVKTNSIFPFRDRWKEIDVFV